MVWCFQCGAPYEEDVLECVECGVATFPTQPQPATDVGGHDEEQLAYEFHEWSYRARGRLEASLRDQTLEHAWLGPTLIVCERDEEAVDRAVEQVLRDELPELDQNQPTVVYEMDEFGDDQRAAVLSELLSEHIAHETDDDGNLVVGENDEEAVDGLFDRMAGADAPPRFGPGLPGVEPYEVLEALFLAADRLRRTLKDSRAVQDFVIAHDQVTQLSLPWGYTADFWRSMLDCAEQLRDILATDPDPGAGEMSGVEAATALRDHLRPYM
ncbi:hypothetical protein [Candidatus Poriferisocius sp.]|uniref:hypothetical protein n=1 Tax=Candidatus Poriferisocius sp. TaxID=3101276 RepID=UPI003B014B78